MTRTVNIEVYADNDGRGSVDVFGVTSDHRPDFPKPFNDQLQEWAAENFSHLQKGDAVNEAGEMEYEPNSKIVEFRTK